MRIFTKLAVKLFGRFIPVSPYVQTFADGLRTDPTNYTAFVPTDNSQFVFRQVVGGLAENGFIVCLRNQAGRMLVAVTTYYFDRLGLNAKEAQLLADAGANWLQGEVRAQSTASGSLLTRAA